MALTDQQKQTITRAIERKAPNLRCSCCASRSFTLATELSLMSLESRSRTSSMLPSAVLVCRTCGNTLLFNLFVLGLTAELGVGGGGSQ